MFDESVLALMTCRAIDMDISGGEDQTQYGPPTFYDRFEKFEKKIDARAADAEAKRSDDYKKANSIN